MMCWLTCSSRTKVRTGNECVIDLCVTGAHVMTKLQTVAELPEFQRRAKAVMSDDQREAAIVWIAENPEAGTAGRLRIAEGAYSSGRWGQARWISDDLRLWWSAYADLPGYGLHQK